MTGVNRERAAQEHFKAQLEANKENNNNKKLLEDLKKELAAYNAERSKGKAEEWVAQQKEYDSHAFDPNTENTKELVQTFKGMGAKGYDTLASAVLDVAHLALILAKVISINVSARAAQFVMRNLEYAFRKHIMSANIFNRPDNLGVNIAVNIQNKGELSFDCKAQDEKLVLKPEQKEEFKKLFEEYLVACGCQKENKSWKKEDGSFLTDEDLKGFEKAYSAAEVWMKGMLAKPAQDFKVHTKFLDAILHQTPEPETPRPRP